MEESKGVALAILGIVAVVAVFGLVLLFSSAKTGKVTNSGVQFHGSENYEATLEACESGELPWEDCRGLELQRYSSEGVAQRQLGSGPYN